jgi:hypothetical protein
MFCLWIASHKLYKEHVFPWLLHKNAYAWVKKCLTLNGNCNMNEIFLAIHSIYIFPFLPICIPTQVSGASFLSTWNSNQQYQAFTTTIHFLIHYHEESLVLCGPHVAYVELDFVIEFVTMLWIFTWFQVS